MRNQKNIELRVLEDNKGCDCCKSKIKCLDGILNSDERALFGKNIRRHVTFKAEDRIFKVEKKFKSVYAIKSGAVKTQAYAYDGSILIRGFYFSGDLIGIESIGDSFYRNDAIALQTTTVCEIRIEPAHKSKLPTIGRKNSGLLPPLLFAPTQLANNNNGDSMVID
jgi:CRP/FNR family transcriptional regulator